MQNYLRRTLKNLQNPLFLETPNGFLFLDQAIWLINQTTRVRFPVKSSGFFKSLPSFGGDVKLSVPATT
jgi:hypothetical protein